MIFSMMILLRKVKGGMGSGIGGGSLVGKAFILSFFFFGLYTGAFS